MLNQTVLIGRLVQDPKIKELENGRKVSEITLAVPRSYKNSEGIYETDFIPCIVWNGVAENTTEFCKKGDLVGIKGRLQTDTYEKDGKNITKLNVIAEKVTFLSSKNEDWLCKWKDNVEEIFDTWLELYKDNNVDTYDDDFKELVEKYYDEKREED